MCKSCRSMRKTGLEDGSSRCLWTTNVDYPPGEAQETGILTYHNRGQVDGGNAHLLQLSIPVINIRGKDREIATSIGLAGQMEPTPSELDEVLEEDIQEVGHVFSCFFRRTLDHGVKIRILRVSWDHVTHHSLSIVGV
jgi:hypothetical protein